TDEHRISRNGVTRGHLPLPKLDIQPDDIAEQFRPGEGEANERQEDQNDGEGDAGIDGFAGLTLLLHQTFSSDSTSPRMPEGRKISTSTRMEKAITSLSRKWRPRMTGPTASTRHRHRPQRIAPVLLTQPPRTAVVTAS